MAEFNPNRVMHGNGGAAWWNGRKLATLQSVEAKVTGDFTIITALKQKGTNKVERVAYSDVTVTEFRLAKFEKKAKTEEEVPFKFGGFEVLESL